MQGKAEEVGQRLTKAKKTEQDLFNINASQSARKQNQQHQQSHQKQLKVSQAGLVMICLLFVLFGKIQNVCNEQVKVIMFYIKRKASTTQTIFVGMTSECNICNVCCCSQVITPLLDIVSVSHGIQNINAFANARISQPNNKSTP